MIEFITATYNEQDTIEDLILHVYSYVDRINICDDESTDSTIPIIYKYVGAKVQIPKIIKHTGLPEVVKSEALKMCDEDSWVLLLDCDERYAPGVRGQIMAFINSEKSKDYTHVWFNLEEAIDGRVTRHFQKCRLFRKSAVTFSDNIHIADSFAGTGANYDWTVLHHKTSTKQQMREYQYLRTYDKLVEEGKMTPEKREELKSMHYFIR